MFIPKLFPYWPERLFDKLKAQGDALDAIAEIDSVWAMEPKAAGALRKTLDRIDLRAHADEFAKMSAAENAEPQDGEKDQKPYVTDENGIACICISGVLTKRPISWGRNTSTVLVRRAVRLASSDEKARAIALIIDSPGGQVAGTADLAEDVRAARAKKPVGAYIEDMGCSAAYWIASQADFIDCNSTAQVGSIGTLIAIEDRSKAFEMAGVKTHVIATGRMKGIGTAGVAIESDQLDDLRREVEESNDEFVRAVSIARGLSSSEIRALEAKVFVGKNALKRKLVDHVGTIDQFFERIQNEFAQSSHSKGGAERSHPRGKAKDDKPTEPRRAAFSLPGLGAAKTIGAADADPAKEKFMKNEAQGEAIAEGEQGSSDPSAFGENGKAAAETDFEMFCRANGIETISDLSRLQSIVDLGRRHEAQIRSEAQTQAIRAYGPEVGRKLSAQCEALAVDTVVAMRDGWKAEADAKFGIEKDGKSSVRKSAPLPLAISAEPETKGQRLWDRLGKEQQAVAEKMGITGESERERFASLYLNTQEGEK